MEAVHRCSRIRQDKHSGVLHATQPSQADKIGHISPHGIRSGTFDHNVLISRVCLRSTFLVLGSSGTGSSAREMLEPIYTADVLQPERDLQHCTRCQYLSSPDADAAESPNATPTKTGAWAGS